MKKIVSTVLAALMLSGIAVPASAESYTTNSTPAAEVQTIGKLGAPKLKIVSKTKNTVTLKWSTVKGAQGYGVFRKVNGKYKRIAVVRSGSKVKYKVKKLKAGTKYAFRVAAYKKVSGKTKWGKKSNTKSAVTKPDYSSYDEIIANYKSTEHYGLGRYYIVDIDSDKLAELFIEDDAQIFDVYTMKNGKAVSLGQHSFPEFSGLYKNSGRIDAIQICSAFHRVNRLGIKDGELTKKTVHEWKSDSSSDPDKDLKKYTKNIITPKKYK